MDPKRTRGAELEPALSRGRDAVTGVVERRGAASYIHICLTYRSVAFAVCACCFLFLMLDYLPFYGGALKMCKSTSGPLNAS